MTPKTQERFVLDMLTRFSAAGEWGIARRYVPSNILGILQERGHVTKLETTPRITETGRRALSAQERDDGR